MSHRGFLRFSAAGVLLMLLVACSDNVAGPLPDPPPPPPSPPNVAFNASGSPALAGVTEIVFTANTGGMSSYQWDFGDGSQGSGQTVRKVYERGGNYHVALRVTNSSGGSSGSEADVVVKSLDGLWDDDFQQYGVKVTQSGHSFKGRTVFRIKGLTGATTGSIDDNLRITYQTSYAKGVSDRFEGRLDSSLDRITGKLTLQVFGASGTFNMNFVRK